MSKIVFNEDLPDYAGTIGTKSLSRSPGASKESDFVAKVHSGDSIIRKPNIKVS